MFPAVLISVSMFQNALFALNYFNVVLRHVCLFFIFAYSVRHARRQRIEQKKRGLWVGLSPMLRQYNEISEVDLTVAVYVC